MMRWVSPTALLPVNMEDGAARETAMRVRTKHLGATDVSSALGNKALNLRD